MRRILAAASCAAAVVAGVAACSVPQVGSQPVGEITVPDDPGPAVPPYAEQRDGTAHVVLSGLVNGTYDGAVTCSREADIDGTPQLAYGFSLGPDGRITAQLKYKPSTGWAAGYLDDGPSPAGAYGLAAASAVNLPVDLSGGTVAATFRPQSGAAGDLHLNATVTCPAAGARRSATPPAVTPSPTFAAPHYGYSTLTSAGDDSIQVSRVQNTTCGVLSLPDGTWVARYGSNPPMGDDQVWFAVQVDLATGVLTGTVTDQRAPGHPVTLTLNPVHATATRDWLRVTIDTPYTVSSGKPAPNAATPTVTESGSPVLSGNQVYIYIDCEPQGTTSPTSTATGP